MMRPAWRQSRAVFDFLAAQRRFATHPEQLPARPAPPRAGAGRSCAGAGAGAQDIRRCVAQLHAEGLSGRTLGCLLSAWRGLFAWLGEAALISCNPCSGIRPPKSPWRLPRALSVDESAALLTPAEDENEALGARDTAMFELFYSSGLRLPSWPAWIWQQWKGCSSMVR